MALTIPDPPSVRFEASPKDVDTRDTLVMYIHPLLERWKDHRETNYESKWNEYYRLWRGIWSSSDKTRKSERSKIISPALQQAIEAQVAEIEEAIFSRPNWFVVVDDFQDEENMDVQILQKRLIEDFDKDRVEDAISEAFLNGAIYGTGIAKIVITKELQPGTDDERLAIKVVAVDPREFIIDSSARCIEDAHGVAHETLVPRHVVLEKIRKGVYDDVYVGAYTNQDGQIFRRDEESGTIDTADQVKITEYYGLVPRNLLDNSPASEVVDLFPKQESLDTVNPLMHQDEELVEAWVSIANDSTILRAIPNPFNRKDRPFVAYQHDTVPNRFWGRGVSEKGYNSQKALDAELRARMDSLALSTYPMLAMDGASVPPNGDFQIRPGRTLITVGDPNSSIREFKFSEPGPANFQAAAEWERFVQVGTGSLDSATPIGISPRNSTATGVSILQAGAVKRQKRTLQNIERTFLGPLIAKIAHRYQQFDSVRYPEGDFKFVIRTGLGLIARELEQQQLVNLLNTTEAGSPSYWMILNAIWDNSSVQNREEMKELTQQLLQQSMQPPEPPPPDPMVEVKMAELEYKNKELEWRQMMDVANYRHEDRRINQRSIEYAADMQRIESDRQVNEAKSASHLADGMLKIAKAESEEVGRQLDAYSAQMEELRKSLDAVHSEGESARQEASSEFLDLVKALDERTQALENQEPAVQTIIQKGTPGPQGPAGAPAQMDPAVLEQLQAMQQEIESLKSQGPALQEDELTGDIRVDRDANGLITSVGGRRVRRNAQGLIEGI